jgi:ATP-dependent DNA ligase
VLILGWKAGEGRRAGTIGALLLGVLDESGTLRCAGRRLRAEVTSHPATFVIFDVLADAGTPTLDQPLHARRARLEALLAGAPPNLVVCPQTTDPDRLMRAMRPSRRSWHRPSDGPRDACCPGSAGAGRPRGVQVPDAM